MRLFLILAITLALIAGAVLLLPGRTPGSSKPTMVATIFPLADWLREIGGGEIEVHCLVSGAADPHHFEPSVDDALKVTNARAVFAVGLEMDPWIKKLVKNSGSRGAYFETGAWIQTKPLSQSKVIEIHGEHHEHEAGEHHHHHGSADPHYWLDPARARTVVKRMTDELTRLFPEKAEEFRKRSDRYINELDVLDQVIAGLALQAPKTLELVTFHDAYGYLFERMNIKTAAVVQAVPGVQPSVRDCANAIQVMKEIRQQTIFLEPASSMQGAAKVLAKELNAKIEVLDPLDTQSSLAGKNYLERIKHNIHMLGSVRRQ